MRRRFHLPLLGQISPSEVCGHLAFLLAGTAFLDPEILNLRVLSVAAGGATLVFTFFHPIGRPLWLPCGWNVIFMAINGGHIYQILSERQAAERLPPQALELWQSVFAVHGVSKTNFARLLEYGTWTTFREGMTLQEEGRPSNSLFLVVRGKCDVNFAGVKTHSLGDHQFIGDMGLSSGIRISTPVTSPNGVTTSAQTTCLVWRRQQLYQALDQRPELAAAFQAAVGADLVRKLQEPTAADAESRHRLWELRYAAIVEAVLASGEASSEQRQQLAHYRATHNVGDAAHRDALRASGWSEAEFEAGRRAAAAAAAAPHRGGAAGIELGLSAAAAAAGEAAAGPGAAAPSSSAEASSSSKKPERRQSSLRRHASLGRWAIPEPPLALWDERKAQVVAVQERLNQFFGTTALEIDGEFGPLTAQAVELFQLQAGLQVCGRVGRATWQALRQAHLKQLESEHLLSVVRGFDDGVDLEVALLQQRLQMVLGADVVTADGVYGPRTRRAVEAFKRKERLATAAVAADGAAAEEGAMSREAEAVLRDLHLRTLESRALLDADSASPWRRSGVVSPVGEQDIKLLQLSLNQLMGYDVVTADGVYGRALRKPSTTSAAPSSPSTATSPLSSVVLQALKKRRRSRAQTEEDDDADDGAAARSEYRDGRAHAAVCRHLRVE